MKKIIILLLLCLSVNLASADNDTVYIYAFKYHPPYELLDHKGSPTGLTIELLRESMNRLHLRYKIIMCSKDYMLKNIHRHKNSLISGIELTEDEIKQHKLHIGITYRYLFRSILTKADTPKKYTAIDNIKGWRIAIEMGDISTDILKDPNVGCKILVFKNIHDAVQSTLDGKTDGTYTDDAQAREITKSDGLEDKLTQTDMGMPPLRYSMVGNDSILLRKIGLQFMDLKADGTYSKIESHWLFPESNRVYVHIIIYILVVAIILALFIVLLRAKVEKAKKLIGIRNTHLELAMNTAGIVTWHYHPDKQKFEIFTDVDKKPSIYDRYEILNFIAYDNRDKIKSHIDDMDKRRTDEQSDIFKIQDPIRIIPPHHYKVTYKAVRNSERFITSYTGVSQDLEDLIAVQQRLEKEKQHAINADRLKSAFLANISHEIRTPLNAIVGFSQLLQNSNDEKERAKFMNIINTNNEQLLRIITDIIDLSKIETNTSDIILKNFDVCKLVEEVVESERTAHSDSQVKISFESNNKVCPLYNDQTKIQTAAANIIENAYKFTENGSIDVRVYREKKYVRIIVSDTGIGISESDCERIFDSFVKVNSFTLGVGLGLTISKADIIMLGGDIAVESEQGRGSTFTISIPTNMTTGITSHHREDL